MDFFSWACYINCIFKYYKIFVTDRYCSKLGLTVSDSDWNIYVMAPVQGGQRRVWEDGGRDPARGCSFLPRVLGTEPVPGATGQSPRDGSCPAPVAAGAAPARPRAGTGGWDPPALPGGSRGGGSWPRAALPALAHVWLCCQSLPETEHSSW